jgi:hypothetical protein
MVVADDKVVLDVLPIVCLLAFMRDFGTARYK